MTMLPLFITFLLGAVVCLLLLSLSRFVGPRRPTPVKVLPFECGMEQIDKPGHRCP
jgi:NADH-quinone oxidoreductase subunit A